MFVKAMDICYNLDDGVGGEMAVWLMRLRLQ